MTTLIITGQDDVHADAVIPLLEGVPAARPVIRLNTDNLADNALFSIYGGSWDGEFRLIDSGRSFQLSDIRSVWFRKPTPIRPSLSIRSEQAAAFISNEYNQWLRSVYGLLADRFWVSGYWNVLRASQKLPNLRVAAGLGLMTPNTLVTNQVDEARAFAEACGWRVLVKPFVLETFKLDEQAPVSWDVFATTFDQAFFASQGDAVKFTPTLLQEYVEKDIELRVTVVGRQVFCTAIESQAHPEAIEDWRAVDVELLDHHPFPLPPEIESKLIRFNQIHGLQFSTFDMIIDKSGHFVWLECNPNGQWRWIETLTGQPIAEAMAALLRDPDETALFVN